MKAFYDIDRKGAAQQFDAAKRSDASLALPEWLVISSGCDARACYEPFDQHDSGLPFAKVSRVFKFVAHEPRFIALMRQVGLSG